VPFGYTQEYLDAMNLKGKDKLRVEMEGNRIVLYSPDTDDEMKASGE
jgi:hypothetical protein